MGTPPQRDYKTARRVNAPGHAHYLTFSCYRRRLLLNNQRHCEALVSAIRVGCAKCDFALIAYVFMPEHVHLLVHPRQDVYDIGRFLFYVKQPVAAAAVKSAKLTGPDSVEYKEMSYTSPSGEISLRFWQPGGGYDRNVFNTAQLWQ
jgi:putative transposase